MTQIGVINCQEGVVLFADRQETIPDYAKWDVGKISFLELQGTFRLAMAGAGDANIIEMVWEQVVEGCRSKQVSELKDTVIGIIHQITKKAILPMPREDRPYVDLIWVIQAISPTAMQELKWGPLVFRTHSLAVNGIRSHFFTGSPVLLTKFLSDQFLEGLILGVDEAEALSTYILWEAKEYDPYCGKYSDVYTFGRDGRLGRLSLPDAEYWEGHWKLFKEGLRFLPLLSCSTSLSEQIYNPKDRLQRLITTIKTLNKEQKKMRLQHRTARNKLEEKLMGNLRKTAMKYNKPKQ